MVVFKTGNILAEEAEALVNSVNCVGIMGRGVALQFKKAFPENFDAYEAACRRGEVEPGRMFVFETKRLTNPRFIINFPTKRHWRGLSRIADIESGLRALVAVIRERGIRSIAIPPLGCGLGGLNWSDVRSLLERAVGEIPDLKATIFEPSGTPPEIKTAAGGEIPAMTPARAALVGLIDRYRAGFMDTSVTLLEIHKLMYFMQEAGEPLKLRYVQGPYGPYAENLRHLLLAVDGHFISGFSDGADRPDTELELIPGALKDAAAVLGDHPETRARFNRVAELVAGFESPFGLELLSTVHWVAKRLNVLEPRDLVDRTYEWGERKRQFSKDQLLLALDVLANQGWVPNPQCEGQV
jgi:O-acetyl-ADP-ribose deacetylase (regulator of RNase III)